MIKVKLEYVWIDGFKPWGMRSKIKVQELAIESYDKLKCRGDVSCIPRWGFDGSSTLQAEGNNSDCILRPVRCIINPLDDCEASFIVLCDVLDHEENPHATNHRVSLVETESAVLKYLPAFGMEQEYTILGPEGRPLGFPAGGYPAPQGIYYCSVGGDRSFGRDISDCHLDACLKAGISITGTNAEVMPGQWEYQVGGPNVSGLQVSDELWLSRWLLLKIAERQGLTVTFDPKPMMGDWNGAGCHTNFSTALMRDSQDGIRHIEQACKKLSKNVEFHLGAYGDGIELRLTGEHETCSYKEFKWGVADRTASVRIPLSVHNEGRGYLEDRRPNANCDPYEVCNAILTTVCLSKKGKDK